MKQNIKILNDQIAKTLNDTFRSSQKAIVEDVKKLVEVALNKSNVAVNLRNKYSELVGHLGLEFPLSTTDSMIQSLVDTTEVKLNPIFRAVGNKLKGGILVTASAVNFEDLKNTAWATYQNKGKSGGEIPWFEWLVKHGDRQIISDFHVATPNLHEAVNFSRTGFKIMKKGKRWGMLPEFSGVHGRNFVSEALQGIDPDSIMAAIFRNMGAV